MKYLRWTATLIVLSPLGGCDISLPADDGDGRDTDDAATDGSGDDGDDDGGDGITSGADDTGDSGGLDEDSSGGISTCDVDETSTFVHSGTIEDDTWGPGIHVVGNATVVGALEVLPCAQIRMEDSATITVRDGGSVSMVGEPDARILMTSDSPAPAPGDWDLFRIDDSAAGPDNVFAFVDIEYGGGDSIGAMLQLARGASLTMSDCTVRHSAGVGLRLDEDAEVREFVGNTITDNDGAAMRLHPSTVGHIGTGTYAPNGVEGIVVVNGTLRNEAVWLGHDAPYILDDLLLDTEAGSAHLTIQAGASVLMVDDAAIFVRNNAGLTLAGTADAPVIIESAKSSGEPADWDEIRIEAESVDDLNDFEHVVIRHGGGNTYGAVRVEDGASLRMSNSTVEFNEGPGMTVEGGAEVREFTNNSLINNTAGAIAVRANAVDQLGAGVYAPNDVEGIFVRAEDVDHDSTWVQHDAPYVVVDRFDVETESGSANLTLAAGVELRFSADAALYVRDNGSLTAAGTARQPVLITSAKMPPEAGDWDEIRFEDGSTGPNNVLSYVQIEYGGSGTRGQVWVQGGASVQFDHASFGPSGSGCDISADGTVSYADTPVTECP